MKGCAFLLFLGLVYSLNSWAVTTTVSVTIPGLVQISGLSDIALAPTSIASPVLGATSACIYTNVLSPLGSYYVTATSANGLSGAFRVANGSKFVTYNAFWNTSSAATPTLSLASAIKTVQLSGGNSASLNCGGVANANFNILFTTAQLTTASAITYSDTVTLLISPS